MFKCQFAMPICASFFLQGLNENHFKSQIRIRFSCKTSSNRIWGKKTSFNESVVQIYAEIANVNAQVWLLFSWCPISGSFLNITNHFPRIRQQSAIRGKHVNMQCRVCVRKAKAPCPGLVAVTVQRESLVFSWGGWSRLHFPQSSAPITKCSPL